jgi:hypothetical protein
MDRFSQLACRLHAEACVEDPDDYENSETPTCGCSWEGEEEIAKRKKKPIDWEEGEHGEYYKMAERIYTAVRSIWE